MSFHFREDMKKEYPDFWRIIGMRLYHAREAQGLTLRGVEDSIGFTSSGLSKVEAGLQGCSVEALFVLAKLYGLSLDALIEEALQ